MSDAINVGDVESVLHLRDDFLSALENGIKGFLHLGNVLKDVESASTIAGAAIAGIASALAEAAIHAVEAGNRLQDFNYVTGISVEKATGLNYAMQAVGGSLDQLQNALFMMQRRMTETPDKFEVGLERIHLHLRDIQSLKPDEQFLAIATAFRENTTESDRAATAMELFGRQGRELVPALMKPLQELTEQAHKLGIEMSGTDAKAAEELAMWWNKLKASAAWMVTETGFGVVHFFQDIGIAAAEANVIVERLARNLDSDIRTIGNNQVNGGLPDIPGAPRLKAQRGGSDTSVPSAAVQGSIISDDLAATIRYNAELESLHKHTEGLTAVEKARIDVLHAEGDSEQWITQVIGQSRDEATKKYLASLAAEEKAFKDESTEIVRLNKERLDFVARQHNEAVTQNNEIIETERQRKEAEEMREFHDQVEIDRKLMEQRIEFVRHQHAEAEAMQNASMERMRQNNITKFTRVGDEIGNVILSAVEGGGDVWKSIGVFIGNSIAHSLIQSVASHMADGLANAIVGGLSGGKGGGGGGFFSFLGGLFGLIAAPFTGGASLAATIGIGSSTAASIGGLVSGTFAEGGSGMVSQPTLFMAGEAGPEHYEFTPAGKQRSGGGTVINVNISAWDSQDVKQRGIPQIVQALKEGAGLSDVRFLVNGA